MTLHKKIHKKELLIIFFIFFIINFVTIMNFSIIKNSHQNIIVNNSYLSNNFKYFVVEDTKISFKDFISSLQNFPDITIKKTFDSQDNKQVIALLFNNIISKNLPPIIFGSEFTIKDMLSEEPLCLVGKNFKKDIIKIDNIDYIFIDNIKYKVKGILGYSNNNSAFDNKYLINLSSLNKLDINDFSNLSWQIDSPDTDLNSFISYLKDNMNINITFNEINNSIFKILTFDKLKLTLTILTLFLIISCTINFIKFFIDSTSSEICVKRCFGATKFDIYIEIFNKFIFISLLSSVFSIIIEITMSKINIFNESLIAFSFKEILLIISSNIIIVTFISLKAVLFTLKIPTNKLLGR